MDRLACAALVSVVALHVGCRAPAAVRVAEEPWRPREAAPIAPLPDGAPVWIANVLPKDGWGQLSADGSLLLVSNADETDVVDLARGVVRGRLLFTTPAHLGPFTPDGRSLVACEEQDASCSLVDARTRARGAPLPAWSQIIDLGVDGRLLVTDETAYFVVDLETRARIPVRGLIAGQGGVLLPDGRTVAQREPGGFLVARVGGGARLHVVVGAIGALVFRDDGHFDGPERAWSLASYRMGPSVSRSRVAPLAELAATYREPGLLAAFLAAPAP